MLGQLLTDRSHFHASPPAKSAIPGFSPNRSDVTQSVRPSRSRAVNLFGIDKPFAHQFGALGRYAAKETAAKPLMAGSSFLPDEEKNGVSITVDPNRDDLLHMPA